jgi:hypothetical protein
MKKILLILMFGALLAAPVFAVTLTITQPIGGELCKGTHYTIKWTASGVTTPVKLALRQGGSLVGVIKENIPVGTTQFDWVVGDYEGGSAGPGTGYKIRVRTQDNGPYDDGGTFNIKFCVVFDPHKYLLENIKCRIPGPGCPGCPPEFDLSKWRERFGDLRQNVRLVLLKNGARLQELGSIGKGKRFPNSVKTKLSEADLLLLKNGGAQFAIGIFDANGKLLGSSAIEMTQ